VSITKTASQSPASEGTQPVYALEVHNDGPDAALDVTVTDTVAPGTPSVTVSLPTGWQCSQTPPKGGTGSVACAVRSTLAAESRQITSIVRVPGGTDPGTYITNVGRVSSPTPDPFHGDNASSVTTRVRHREERRPGDGLLARSRIGSSEGGRPLGTVVSSRRV